MHIRGGSGLGDAMYLRPIAEHFAKTQSVTAHTDYPEVFIGSTAQVAPFTRRGITVLAHYSTARFNPKTTQYQDMLNSAGIRQAVPLRFTWNIRNPSLIERLRDKAGGRPLILLHGGRAPFGRIDGFGKRLMPERWGFEAALSALEDCFVVRVGKADQYPLPVNVDLHGKTTVSDVCDLGSACDGVLAQCSWAVPLAEIFDKPLLAVWASRGLVGGAGDVIRTITPQKILSKSTSSFVVDDWPKERIRDATRRALNPIEIAA